MSLTQNIQKFISYRRTLRALKATAMDTRWDLNLYSGDFNRIAHKAVYGY